MSDNLVKKTQAASEQWRTAFNDGNAAGCASLYEEDAKMVAKPFGTYIGRQQIEAFWQELIEQGFAKASYIDPTISVVDSQSTLLTSEWTMNNAQGVITKELWVLQSDGTMRLREDHFEAIDSNA